MKTSLSIKITLAVVSLVALSGTITGYLIHTDSTAALQKSITSNQTDSASQTMDKIDRFLYERQASLESISGRQQIQDFLTTQPDQRDPATAALLANQLNEFETSSGSWTNLAIVSTNGSLPIPNQQQNLQAALARQPSILKLFGAAVAGQAGHSDALALIPGQPPIMLFMTPIRNNQAKSRPVIGVLVGQLAWQSNLDILKDLSSAKATLINDKGLSLGENTAGSQNEVLSKDLSKSLVFKTAQNKTANSGSGIFPGLDQPKQNFLTSYVKETGYLNYHGNGWTLVLETSKAVAFAPVNRLSRTLETTFGALFVLSTLTLLLAMRFLVLKPITNLKEVTGRLAKGDFSLRTTINSNDELGSLGRDFNDMADRMQLANASLIKDADNSLNQKQVLEVILDNLPVGVMVLEAPDAKLIKMNKAGAQMVGRGFVEGVDKNNHGKSYDVIKADGSPYPDDELPLITTMRSGEITVKDDMVFRRPDGTQVPVRAMDAPIKDADHRITSVVSVFEDISKERELERSRDEFFSIASHELRTPLTAIMGNSSLIQQYYGDKLPDDSAREMVSDIHESSLRLIEIVNDFLDTSRLEQKHMKYETVNFNVIDIANSVVKEYQVTGSRKKIHLEVIEPQSPLPLVKADQNRTKQVLINLVGNSMKFTEAGKITISFQPGSKYMKVLISDTGRGMSDDAKQLLFRKFEQTGATVLTRDSVRGTGLGLYISKLITEQMGGSIKLESSEEGVGTTFSFTLPLAPDS